jgi:hypothetical protein
MGRLAVEAFSRPDQVTRTEAAAQNRRRPKASGQSTGNTLTRCFFSPAFGFTIVFTARAVNWNYTPVPVWDYWDDVASVDQLVRFDPKHFWAQHNEHRILFPEILFALDYRWFSGTEVLPIAASIVCRLTQLLILLWVLWHTTEIRGPTRLGVAAAVTIFMTSVMQIEAIDSPFLLQWYLSDLGATASLLLLWRAAPPRGGLYALVFSLIAAVIATYSSGNGMVIWPILICLAIYVRFPRTRLAAIGLTGTAAVGAYFINYRWMNQGGLWKLISRPVMTARFVGLYVGAPISYTYRSNRRIHRYRHRPGRYNCSADGV